MKLLSRHSIAPCLACLVLASLAPSIRAQADIDSKLADLARQADALKASVEAMRQSQLVPPATAPVAPPARQGPATTPVARIREEALERSKLMETLTYITEVVGPRLTGSPNIKRGSEWTRDKLASWGLVNAKLEPWGPFGRGWSLKRFSAQVVEPIAIPLIAYPKAWSPGLDHAIVADVVLLDAQTEADLDKYRGKLKDTVVLITRVRDVAPRFQPLATRSTEAALLTLANAQLPAGRRGGAAPARGGGARGNAAPAAAVAPGAPVAAAGTPALPNPAPAAAAATPAAAPQAAPNGGARGGAPAAPTAARILALLLEEGAAMAVTASTTGDGGTVFVSQVTVPAAGRRGGPAAPAAPAAAPAAAATPAPTYYSVNPPANLPQITVAVEDYNRLVRMAQLGEKLKMAVDMQVQFHADDLMSYNIVAEIPGTDLKDEIVMLGGHFDSWQAGTGATDNAAGVAVAIEAIRIIKELDLKPRRTIRIALWSGEEEGLLGSAAYVRSHFGYFQNAAAQAAGAARGEGAAPAAAPAGGRTLVKMPEYDRLSAYYNLDNGTGKIRGIYMQGNEGVRTLFRQWLQPFNDLGASTLTISNTGSTDHASFDNIGLPGFQFIQDSIEYNSRTHHSNADVLDRIQPEDLKQAAAIMAAFVYNTAMLDEKLPRKSVE